MDNKKIDIHLVGANVVPQVEQCRIESNQVPRVVRFQVIKLAFL
ncbi:unnamed protein product [Paramecium sonneborni]|uniref:Uncharacterized protein n=1 Tax=Paramecium sonneborni TaxID=65129 RepID=A0A8S1KBL6_9CILI|nr:unnamed protein product [Paramecium sonneborni]